MLVVVLLLFGQTSSAPMNCATPIFDRLFPNVALPMPETKRSANPPALGEKRLVWLQNMTVMPPRQYQAEMTCRARGLHCYVMVDDSVWNAGLVDSADAARIVERFENSSPRDPWHGVWYHNTTNLGMPPDAIDNDSAVYLFYYNIGTYHGIAFDGFWQYFDEYYDSTAMRMWGYHSNEVECVYLDCYPNSPSEDYRIAIAAHEFGHMIQWNYDQAEETWVQEGFCELAMWLFGAPDRISGFPSNSDNDLTAWSGSWADYIKTYLWSLFLYEQYGGRVGTELIHNIIASPERGLAGVDAGFEATGLSERFEGVLDQWVVACRINDTSFAGGKYGYFGERVPYFATTAYHVSYPVARSADLARWAGEHVLFGRGRTLELEFDGEDFGNFHVFVFGEDTINGRILLDTVELDSVQHGTTLVPGFDTAYQLVYLIPVNHNPAGRIGYSYQASVTGAIAEQCSVASESRPAPTVVRARDLWRISGNVNLVSVSGRLVERASVSAGVYFLVPGVHVNGRRRLLVVR